MAFPQVRLLISLFFLVLCLLHKLIALIVVKNVLGLPDYVIGELLANSNIIGKNRLLINTNAGEREGDLREGTSHHVLSHQELEASERMVRFTPQTLDFNQHSVGMPYIQRVMVENLQEDSALQMLSISGNTVHFHCSFFEDKVIAPMGNTSFEVVFLARQQGQVSNTLYIHTSVGSFKYQVAAVGIANPYRLRPLVGAKVPLNSSYAQMIHIYNPHSSTLQLTEMYSTGGGLHLELPNGDNEVSKELWQIPPFETKAIMRANFLATSEKNHTAYIRIKTNASDEEANELILPVEVEVSSAPGIYSPVDMLDFGVTRTSDDVQSMSLQIINSGVKSITIQNVISTPINEALDIELTSSSPVRVQPNIYHPTEIAKLVLDPKKITNCWKQCFGKIVVKSKNNQYKLTIPYQVSLLSGFLRYNQSRSQFYIRPNLPGSDPASALVPEKRTLNMINHFNFTLIVHSVSLPDEAKPYFKLDLMGPSVALAPNETGPVVVMTFTPSKQLTQLQTYFRLHTNISYFDFALNAYSGKLEVFIPQSVNQTSLSFGVIGLRDKKSMVFTLINNNPVDVLLKQWGCNVSKAFVELIGIEEGNASVIARKADYSHLKAQGNNIYLKSKHYAILRLHLTGFTEEGHFYGENFVNTEYETMRVSFEGRAIEGSLAGDKLFISNSFPGRISSQTVRVSSSFSSELSLKSFTVSPKDESRFVFEPLTSQTPVNFGDNILGKLYFDPTKFCGISKTCYSGLETSKEVGHLWLLGLALHPDTGYIDKELHKLYYSRWSNMSPSDRMINSTLDLELNSGHRLSLEAQASLQWPRIVYGAKNYLKFPMTRIGNTTVKEIMIENPSSQPLLVQVVLLSDYPNAEAALQALSSLFWWSESELKQAETKPKSFSLLDTYSSTSDSSGHSSSDAAAHVQKIKNAFSVTPASSSVTFMMPVGFRTRITVGFQPQYDSASLNKNTEPTLSASTFFLIRNNLTIIDAIHLSGEGGSGLLKIGNQLPGLKSPLTFDLQEKHLGKSCKKNGPVDSAIEPTFTVQKSFNLVNYGKLPVRVKAFLIGPSSGIPATGKSSHGLPSKNFGLFSMIAGQPLGANTLLSSFVGQSPCQGFGFKVLDCDPNELFNGPDKEKETHDKKSKKTKSKKGKSESREVGFLIRPNESKKIHIAFTPDFTLSKTMATLTIFTDDDDDLYSGGGKELVNATRRPPIIYSLIATVPKHLLSLCSDALPRPYWEFIIYYTLVVFMIFLLLISVVLSFFDGARILNFTFYPIIMMTTAPGGLSATLNAETLAFETFDFDNLEKSLKDKDGKIIDGSTLRLRKQGANNGSKFGSNPKRRSDCNQDSISKSFYESAQSWTSFFKKKFERRDSSGSDSTTGGNKANGNSGRRGGGKSKKNNTPGVSKRDLDSKDVNNGKENPSARVGKRMPAKSWYSLTSSSSEIKARSSPEPPPPLPSFPPVFDDQDFQFRNKGKGKKESKNVTPPNQASVNSISVSNSSTSNSTQTQQQPVNNCLEVNSNNFSLELPYKPGKSQQLKPKRYKPTQEVKSNPFDGEFGVWSNSPVMGSEVGEGSVIWDQPITMFDTEKAMNELVKQTEIFASKDKSYNKPIKPGKGSLNRETFSGGRGGGSKSALCSFGAPSPSPSGSGSTYSAAVGTPVSSRASGFFQQEIQRPTASGSPSLWTSNPSLSSSSTSSIRSSTPPSSFLFSEEHSISRRSPGLGGSLLADRPSLAGTQPVAVSTPAVGAPSPANSWITEALLDTELSYLRDSSSWSSSDGRATRDQLNQNDRYMSRKGSTKDEIPNQSRLKEWTGFGGVELTSSKLWETSVAEAKMWPTSSESTTGTTAIAPSHGSVWNESEANGGPNIWSNSQSLAPSSHPESGDSWIGSWLGSNLPLPSASNSGPVTTSSSAATASSFNLFGRTLWSPIASGTESAAIASNITTTSAPFDPASIATTSSWSFGHLFGNSSELGREGPESGTNLAPNSTLISGSNSAPTGSLPKK